MNTYILLKEIDWFGTKIPVGTRYMDQGAYYCPFMNDTLCHWGGIQYSILNANKAYFCFIGDLIPASEAYTLKDVENAFYQARELSGVTNNSYSFPTFESYTSYLEAQKSKNNNE